MKNKVILPLILVNLLSGVDSVVMFWVSKGDPIWVGAFFTTFPLPFLLIGLSKILKLARTSARLPLIQLLSFCSVALVAYSLYTRQGPSTVYENVALGITFFGALFVQWYVWIYSTYGREKSARIVRGQPLPELPLQRPDGTDITSSSFLGSKTLNVFFVQFGAPSA